MRPLIDVPLMEPAFVAEAALQALNDEETGGAWVVQPNRVLRFRFPNIPGPLMARSRRGWGGDLPAPHVWLTLGYRAIRRAKARR